MRYYLEKLAARENLSLAEMKEAAALLFMEQVSESEAGAFLGLLAAKGENADEMAGLAMAVKEAAPRFPAVSRSLMDNCGTGGDGSCSFNISTASAFVLAGAGITVAKHGNRSISSRTGSADVLENLGVPLHLSPEECTELLEENGIVFLFAPHQHPVLKKVMKIRRDLRIPTIFNMIGPLTNPAELDTQLVGIYRSDKLNEVARVLRLLGRRRAVVLNGAGEMDEATLAGDTNLVIVEGGSISHMTLSQEETGLPYYPNEAIRGGDAGRNADILLGVLRGDHGAYRDTVLLNAGLGIFANGTASTIQEGIHIASESIDSGAALSKLQCLIQYSRPGKQVM